MKVTFMMSRYFSSGIMLIACLALYAQSPGCGCPATGDCTISKETGPCTITGTINGNLTIAKDNTVNFAPGSSVTGSLTTTGENVVLNFNATGTITIGNGLNIAKDATINVASGAEVNITGDITFTGNENSFLTVNGDLTATGDIICSPNCGDHGLSTGGSGSISIGGMCDDPSFCSGTVTEGVTALPVELTHWSITSKEDKIQASWSTATEINNDFFTIEESVDGVSFLPNHTERGAGNSQNPQFYEHTISPLHTGREVLFFRLRQTDYDGTSVTFKTHRVDVSTLNQLQVDIFPNPLEDRFLSVKVGNLVGYKLDIFNLSGRRLLSLAPENALSALDLADFENGLYLLQISTADQQYGFKFKVSR